MNAIRSLRDYVDTAKQNRKQVLNKDKDVVDIDQLSTAPRTQLLSNSEPGPQSGPATVGGGGGGGEGVVGEKSVGVPGGGGGGGSNGQHHSRPAPLGRALPKVEDSRQLLSATSVTNAAAGEMGAPSSCSRTDSECSNVSVSSQPAVLPGEMPGKSLSVPAGSPPTPAVSGASGGGGGGEGNEKNNSVISSKLAKHQTQSTSASNIPTSATSQTPIFSDPTKTLRATTVVAVSPEGMPGLELGSEWSQQLLPSDSNSMSSLLPSEMVGSGHRSNLGGGLEASSSSSLIQVIQVSDKALDREKFPGSAASGTERQVSSKKSSRGKPKQLKLELKEQTNDVVKCTLNTSTGQVDFRFSVEYDKPQTIFRKIVSLSKTYVVGVHSYAHMNVV